MKSHADITDFATLKEQMATISRASPTYAKMAQYIIDNYLNIIFMTAVEVADAIEISQGSVSRFCSSLGYKGYNDFLSHLQGFVSGALTAPQRLQYTSANKHSQNQNLLAMEHKNIDELLHIMEQQRYKDLIQRLCKAKEVVLISARMSATLMPYMYYILNKMRPNVSLITPESIQWETLSFRNREETEVFSIALPRYPNVLLKKLGELKEAGFCISAITDSIISPLSNLADLLIEVPITRFSIFDIYSTPLLFLNFLLRDIAKELKGVDIRLDQIEKWENLNAIYFQSTKQ